MFRNKTILGSGIAISVLTTVAVLAAYLGGEEFDLSWNTIDGGGEMFSTGGDFELSATIGQPDAGARSGDPGAQRKGGDEGRPDRATHRSPRTHGSEDGPVRPGDGTVGENE